MKKYILVFAIFFSPLLWCSAELSAQNNNVGIGTLTPAPSAQLDVEAHAYSQDSTNNPITKRLGLTCFPLEKKVGLTYCFGKKGRMKIEDNITLHFSESSYLGKYVEINEFKFMYAWNCTGFKKVYSGVSMEYGTIYYSQKQRNYASYGSIIPIGIECFPFPNISFIFEPNIKYIGIFTPGVSFVEKNIKYFGYVGLEIHIGFCYYLKLGTKKIK